MDALESEAAAAVFGSPPPGDVAGTAEGMVRAAVSGTVEQRQAVVEDPDCPTEILEWVAEHDPDSTVWVAAARRLDPEQWTTFDPSSAAGDQETPRGVLTRLAGDPNRTIRAGCAHNDSTPAATLKALAGDPDPQVRVLVAKNWKCPVGVLNEFARARQRLLRAAVAQNHPCPTRLLVMLADDPEAAVRTAVAGNFMTPWEVKDRLAHDSLGSVRQAVARNDGAGPALLRLLAQDTNSLVADAAKANRRYRKD